MQKKNIMIYHICLVYEIVLICLNQNPRGILEKKTTRNEVDSGT